MGKADRIGRRMDPPLHGGRRLVITDIHGCAQTFLKLIKKVELCEDDQLFILGDMINRGPRSKEVLDAVLDLTEEGFSIHPLMGNHEEALLHVIAKKPAQLKMLLRSRNSMGLLNRHGRLRKRFFRLIRSMPYYYDLGDHLLVHAGLDLKAKKPLEEPHAMVWARNFKLKDTWKSRTIIIGHTPTQFSTIAKQIEQHAPVICLDNGCSHTYLGKDYGRLLCYDLDSGELFKQKNIDQDQ